jgi:3-deoxy-D-manno-octulosonate 8-phosphate phosphatase (KDO 8-P phosphatase)
MGINLLRFGHWLRMGSFPLIGIITGENNRAALKLAQREHFEAVYLKFKNKTEALTHLSATAGIRPAEVAFVFDDVLDLSVASKAQLRFMVRRTASPLLMQYVRINRLADYITAHSGNNHAVREICELLLGLSGMYETVVSKRSAYDAQYARYLETRNQIPTMFFTREAEGIVAGG